MPPITIHKANPADADTLARFNRAMALETEHKHLIHDLVVQGVQRLIAEPALGFYLVAQAEGQPVGSAMVTTEWSDWRNGRFWWLQSVYVEPAYRKHGVFRALYAHIKERAAGEPDVCGFRLYVEKANAGAQATYGRLGMAETEYRVMEELRPGVVYLEAGPSRAA
jgi:GNAT superfamily N-acetyltransferase